MRAVATFAAVLVWTVLFLPSVAFAQASIAGVVKDTSGAVLPGVTVEVTSPVLIEKVRTAISDGSGRYQIVDLRPGTYSITFTLAGFNTYKRDGVALTGTGNVAIDGEMRVGQLEETITVTGETPVVDVQSLTQQRVMNSETIDSLPSARNYFGLARMIPGTLGGGNDVGGSLIQDVGQSVTVHGSRNVDQRITINGINTMTLQAGGNIGGQTPDMGSASEITVDTSSLGADMPTGGVRVNFIPKDGGNSFSNSSYFSMTNDALQGDNFTPELQVRGLGTPNKILHAYDVNQSFGGPFKRDKLWYWASFRYNDVANEAPVFQNLNAFKVNEWLYVPDTANPGVNEGVQVNTSIRVTWQASPRNKIAGTYKADKWCNCPSNISATQAPEAARDRRFPRLRQEHLEWTSPVTNKLLLEAVGMHLYERWGNMHLRVNGGSLDDPALEAVIPQLIGVNEQSNNLNYRILTNYNNTAVPSFAYRVGAAYVTGSHAFKVGWNRTTGYLDEYNYVFQPVSYRFNNGIPNQITQRTNLRARTNLDNDMGIYAQDRWTVNRFTIAAAIRFDMFQTSFPEQTLGPDILAPTRNVTFPAEDNIDWKDLTYRSGFTYDLTGTGKTALKVSFNKYLLGQTLNTLGRDPNPVLAAVTQTNRPWNDRTTFPVGDPRNGNYVPDCNLISLDANGECGPVANRLFGSVTPQATFDPDLITGFNHRQTNWEFSTTVQHELMPRVALDVGYFRRSWANFRVTDNLLVTPADYTTFSLTTPSDPKLEGNSATTISGFVDVVPAKFGQVSNYNTLSTKIGDQSEVWQGMDFTVNARLQTGLSLQGGLSTGRTSENDCDILTALPEMRNQNAQGTLPASQRPLQYCDRVTPWLTQVKIFGTYIIPKVDVQVASTFRTVTGTDLNTALTAANAYLAANSTLGRPLAGGVVNANYQILVPNSQYTDRRNELDIRIGKVVRFGRSRAVISWDFFNALNSNAVINYNQAYASYLRPTEILNARVMKFTVNYDF